MKDKEKNFADYADSIENPDMNATENEQPVEHNSMSIGDPEAVEKFKRETSAAAQMSMADAHAQREHEIYAEALRNHTALCPIRLEDLPSKGMFYPEGTQMWIRAISLGDIKRWSSMNENDWTDITDKIHNIMQSCVTITFGKDSYNRADWKDLIDIDRMYLLFAIHDYSFQEGDNDIRVKLTEKDDVVLRKENVDYIKFDEKIMKYYNHNKRCFSFPVKNTAAFKDTDGKMDIYMPTIGVANWLKDYVQANEQRHDSYDQDFVKVAPLLIKNWRGLSPDTYKKLMDKTDEWGTYEWTLFSKISDLFVKSSMTPVLRYKDSGGVEREAPVIFRDGLKSIYQTNLDIDL